MHVVHLIQRFMIWCQLVVRDYVVTEPDFLMEDFCSHVWEIDSGQQGGVKVQGGLRGHIKSS